MGLVPQESSFKDRLRNILEEARMVLPGMQALFGFQTVAVFNQQFGALPDPAQALHLVALLLVVAAIALAMMPAAWHRIVEPQEISEATIRLSSRLICAALLPLGVGLSLDIYVVFLAVGRSETLSVACAGVTLLGLLALWFAIPFSYRFLKSR